LPRRSAPRSKALETGTGFVFDQPKTEDVIATVRRALAAFELDRPFVALQKRVMQLDVSWERSARRYEHLYKGLGQSE
jgi:starch synthase